MLSSVEETNAIKKKTFLPSKEEFAIYEFTCTSICWHEAESKATFFLSCILRYGVRFLHRLFSPSRRCLTTAAGGDRADLSSAPHSILARVGEVLRSGNWAPTVTKAAESARPARNWRLPAPRGALGRRLTSGRSPSAGQPRPFR